MKGRAGKVYKGIITWLLIFSMMFSGSGTVALAQSAEDNHAVVSDIMEGAGHSEELELSSDSAASSSKSAISKAVARTGKYKSALSGNALKIYKELAKKDWRKATSVTIYFDKTYKNSNAGTRKLTKDLLRGYWSYLRDYADVYWINSCKYIYWWNDNDRIYKIKISPKKYYSSILKEDKAVQKALKKAVKEVKATRGNSTKLYTLAAIHSYACKRIEYGHEYQVVPSEHTITGALLSKYNHIGVCESYAKLVKILCDEFKIPCLLVQGDNHMWNYVKIDNKWYMLDATWDDAGDYAYGYFFLLGRKHQTAVGGHTPENMFKTKDGTKAALALPKLSSESFGR